MRQLVPWSYDAQRCRAHWKNEGIFAFATESSYGLGCDPSSAAGTAQIFRVKGRPSGQPLPIVAADRAQILALGASFSTGSEALATLWPAPLSLVLPCKRALPAAAGRATLAVRVPAHQQLRQFLREIGSALSATSANPSGEPPIVDPEALRRWLSQRRETDPQAEVLVVDGGRCAGGEPSTLVEVCEQKKMITVHRLGAVGVEALTRVLPDYMLQT